MSLLRRLIERTRHTDWPQPFLDAARLLRVEISPFLLYREAGAPGPSVPDDGSAIVRPILSSDLGELAELAEEWTSPGEMEERLAKGNGALGLEVGGHLVASVWWDTERCSFEGLPFALAENEAYLFDARTHREHRGRGVAPLLRHHAYRHLARLGRSGLFSISDRFNRPARRFKERLGARVAASGCYVCVLGRWRRTVRARADDDRFVRAAASVGRSG